LIMIDLGKLKMKIIPKSILLLFALLLSLFAVSCNKNSSQSTNQSAAQPTVTGAPHVFAGGKRYHLKGKVVSVDKQSKMLNVDSEAIPQLMDAMMMPYQVKPESELDKLSPGDTITADVVVQDEKAWLENIAVTGHAAAPASK
jgi:Cu/Ag efflux protein CusF